MPPKPPAAILTYYRTLDEIAGQASQTEGATRRAFATLLVEWGRAQGLTLLEEQTFEGLRKRPIRADGLLVDALHLRRGLWEAKDTSDDLDAAIGRKIARCRATRQRGAVAALLHCCPEHRICVL
jgi:hypothetical protein